MVDDSKAALPNLILEVANVHGGDFGQVTEIINWVSALDYPLLGLKFQPLKADSLAMPDYKWFPVYEELYFRKPNGTNLWPPRQPSLMSGWTSLMRTASLCCSKISRRLLGSSCRRPFCRSRACSGSEINRHVKTVVEEQYIRFHHRRNSNPFSSIQAFGISGCFPATWFSGISDACRGYWSAKNSGHCRAFS